MNSSISKIIQSGPLVGIVISSNKKGKLIGNGPLFKNIQKELTKQGGCSFVFTIEDVKKNTILGYIYNPDENKWYRTNFPFPNIVYNRIYSRKKELEQPFQHFVTLLEQKNIPFFNPHFLDKLEVYQIMRESPELKNYFPETIPLDNIHNFSRFLEKYHCIYIKPQKSSQGIGIMKIKKINDTFSVKEIDKKQIFPNITDLWNYLEKATKNKPFIAQMAISPHLYNGNRYDFRILAHWNKDQYAVTGVGIRQAKKQNLTTHIPLGGKIIPYEEIKNFKHEQFIEHIVKKCGEILSETYGFFGEFSIDACLTVQGNYAIFEINSKPMKFDEFIIEQNRIKKLIQLFYERAIIRKSI